MADSNIPEDLILPIPENKKDQDLYNTLQDYTKKISQSFSALNDVEEIDAGDGITNTGGVFNVNVDDVTIEISADALQVKEISDAQVAAGANIGLDKLDLSDNATFTGNIAFSNPITVTNKVNFDGNSNGVVSSSEAANREILEIRAKDVFANGSGVNFYGNTDQEFPHYIKWFAGGATAMTMDSSGQLGIGTTNPTAMLEIMGEAKLTESTDMGSDDESLATKKYVDDTAAGIVHESGTGYLIIDAPTTQSTTSTSFIMVKEAKMAWGGVMRTSWESKVDGNTGYSKIYVNGSPIGTEKSTTNQVSWDSFVDTSITVNQGDLLQLYYKHSSGANSVFVRNFEGRSTKPETTAVNTD